MKNTHADTDANTPPFSVHTTTSPTATEQRMALLDNPAWGQVFSDHMFTMHYQAGRGWHDGQIAPRQSLALHPAAMVLHYGLGIFEGLKAYRLQDGSGGAALFRPQANARRFEESARRLAMPALPADLFVASVRALARHERDWIPSAADASLYLRPFMISTEAALGVRPGQHFLYAILACPVSSYFKSGAPAVTVWVADDHTRAAPGGTGAAKCGGNYASGLAAQAQAREHGCDQVVFLDPVERQWIEEFGAMNAFFVMDDGSLLTPAPSGTILAGITRDSLIALARQLGHTVHESRYSVDQWQEDARSGRLREAFACGTAAVITPVGQVKGKRHAFAIADGHAGPVTQKLRQALTDIQFGRAADPLGWRDRLF